MKLQHYAMTCCIQKMVKGSVRRWPQHGATFVGYYIACPGCGFRALYMKGPENSIVETGSVERRPAVTPTGAVSFAYASESVSIGVSKCFGCGKRIVVEAGSIDVE